jgi:hypothetical protein
MQQEDYQTLEAEDLASVGGGADEMDLGGAMDMGGGMEMGGGGGAMEAGGGVDRLLGSSMSGLDIPRDTGERVPVSDGRSDFAPAPVYENGSGRFVEKSDFPTGTQFFENSPPPQSNGVLDWIKPGGGYDRSTFLMSTFNSLFRGARPDSPLGKTGYKPF